ncbi:related to NEDD8-activating enzyme E1 regulatory subunit [Ramularia collo-cygni]|uniref:Ubiquitin-like 1-activating enzyme E1A n=1 Tax=Ramularia collo-cygni TaxID=112498 RepID=A0A2D3UUG7_9PEZI|nr:related to NEDD8-activating enzyme E1 regulatory subunit [Ramularia collo-cygni]CZT21272.1 related to NEDD8-activating enzyme E1 regulatory subunit [Ramularia collo-cygni]
MAAPVSSQQGAAVPAHTSNGHNGTNGTTTTAIPTTNGTGESNATTAMPGLSAEEMAQYDRQIRLWGAEAQQRIRSANILLISLRALGTEIAKNLTLAGVESLTIVDEGLVVEEDLGAQFFVREEDIGKPRAESAIPRIQELNPRVKVRSGGSLQNLLGRVEAFSAYDCIIACDHDLMTLSGINAAARVASRPFYAAGIHGFYGYIFADLVGHEFVVEREKSNITTQMQAETLTRAIVSVTTRKENNGKTTEIVKKQELYCPLLIANSSALPQDVLSSRRKLKMVPALLPCLRALFEFQRDYQKLPEATPQDLAIFTTLATNKARELQLPHETLRADFLRSFMQSIGAEIMPTAAFVGGRLSEDVINVLGKREQPIQNFALFDGDGLEGKIYSLYTFTPELSALGSNMSAGMPMSGQMITDMPMDMGNGGGSINLV